MTKGIRLELEDGQNKLVNMAKLSRDLDSKEKAIYQIIKEWGRIQTADIEKIQDKVLEKLKIDNKEELDDKLKIMRECWKEYNKVVLEADEKISKKLNITKRIVNNVLCSEGFEEGENERNDKIFNMFQDIISKAQSELEKKYKLDGINSGREGIEHEEGFWSVNDTLGFLNLEYNQYEEEIDLKCNKGKKYKIPKDDFQVRLDWRIKRIIEVTVNVLRGENSLNDIIKESKEYLEKAEKEASKITDAQEEEFEAQEALFGV